MASYILKRKTKNFSLQLLANGLKSLGTATKTGMSAIGTGAKAAMKSAPGKVIGGGAILGAGTIGATTLGSGNNPSY